MIDLPSGAQAYLQEIIVDSLGDMGLTYRYRYVMPDLALRVPATTGPAGDFPPQDIDTQSPDWNQADIDGDYIDDGTFTLEEFDFAPIITSPGSETAADLIIDRSLSGDVGQDADILPPAPASTFKDPIHEDVIWLCENHALPDALNQNKRPTQLIISISDQESPFGSYNPEVLQLFEAFALPENHDNCDWRPW